MIHHDYIQGGMEWRMARVGIPTGSNISKLLTPARLEPSAQSEPYLLQLLAERQLGYPLDDFGSGWTDRGAELEPEAARWYAFDRGVEVRTCGFVSDDDHRWGASPDRFVGDDGLLEIKCRSAANHVGILFGDRIANRLQVQAQLLVTERAWCDELAYCPGMPAKVVRQERDEEVIEAIQKALDVFLARLDERWADLCEIIGRETEWRTPMEVAA